MTMYGYQYSITGSFGYEYFAGNQKVCYTSEQIVPRAPVRINGFGHRWISDFDREITHIPGQKLTISDQDTGKPVASLVFNDFFVTELKCGKETVTAIESLSGFEFRRGRRRIAISKRYPKGAQPRELYGTKAPAYFAVDFLENLSREMVLFILALPGLK